MTNPKASLLATMARARELKMFPQALAMMASWNQNNPNDKIFDRDGFYPRNEEAKNRWKKFKTIKLIHLIDDITRLTNYDKPILLLGESGVGKEIIGQALHGDRSGKYIAFNCAAVPEGLAESILFGHEKGSFTGAYKGSAGVFGDAEDGTIFLDEIGYASHKLQATLLRAVETGTIYTVGGSEKEYKARIVFATSRENGVLDDLKSRLCAFTFRIPPLRERMEDIVKILDEVDKEQVFPRDYIWREESLMYNVRSVLGAVERYKFYEKLP